jgi:hypothetical protein
MEKVVSRDVGERGKPFDENVMDRFWSISLNVSYSQTFQCIFQVPFFKEQFPFDPRSIRHPSVIIVLNLMIDRGLGIPSLLRWIAPARKGTFEQPSWRPLRSLTSAASSSLRLLNAMRHVRTRCTAAWNVSGGTWLSA